jgi:hypothetical protein
MDRGFSATPVIELAPSQDAEALRYERGWVIRGSR